VNDPFPVFMESPAATPVFRRIVPPVAAAGAIVLFVSLGFWQLDRAAQKEARQALFRADTAFTMLGSVAEPAPFERIEARGRFLPERQVLIDNIVRSGRVGYFVITPFEIAPDDTLLLVNRGWVAQGPDGEADADLAIEEDRDLVRGRAGSLPRVGLRPGEAFAENNSGWPKVAVYPTPDEVAEALGAEILSFVLLLDPEDERGFLRDWQPNETGPMTHYGYAFQWFAMAFAVVAIVAWQIRKRRARS
jgi:surfeit locus 1 family protein